ncbi:hypothetical protein P3L10_034399 [Capsicum annuum]
MHSPQVTVLVLVLNISWCSKKQVVCSIYSRSKYIAAALAVNQALDSESAADLYMEQKKSTEILGDNEAAISIANNPISHGKTTFQDQALFLKKDLVLLLLSQGGVLRLVPQKLEISCTSCCNSKYSSKVGLSLDELGRTPDFLIYGHGQQRRAAIEAVRLLDDKKSEPRDELCQLTDMNSPQYFKERSKKWLKFVTQAKSAGKTPDDYYKVGNETGAAVLQSYNDILKSCNALDYHDLISCSAKLLTDFPEVFEECQELWKAMVIDEFQDTSAVQYELLRILASHKHITIVGDEDQSIFGFIGADASGFDSFRKDFPLHKEVRLTKNYRSTRCIVEAASFLIQNNSKRCQSKRVLTDNSVGSKITIKECCNEDAQCSFVVDKILEISSDGTAGKSSFGDIAILFRRQVSGKIFQAAFRNRKIPFNVHGVAFYRKKVVRTIIAMLRTTLPGSDDGSFRRVFKALLLSEKEETKKVIEHIEKISTVRKSSFISAARDIFSAKVSGTFKRSQLTQGRKVLLMIDMISKLVNKEESISAVITSVANMIPQKYLLEQRAVLDNDGGKLLNEDHDVRPVLQYLFYWMMFPEFPKNLLR